MFKKKKTQSQMSKQEVLDSLGIKNFKQINKNNVKDFTVLIPQMEPEVTKTALQQIPHITTMATDIVSHYKDIMLEILNNNHQNTKSFMDSCDTVIDALKQLLGQKLWFGQKKKVIDSMMQILQMKSTALKEDKQWLAKFAATAGAVAVAIIAIATKTIKK